MVATTTHSLAEMQETKVTRWMLALARGIHDAQISWAEAGRRMRLTAGHVGRVLNGKACGPATLLGASEAFEVPPRLCEQIATPNERSEWARIMGEMGRADPRRKVAT